MVWQIETAVLSDEDLVRTAEWVDLTYFLKKIVRVRNKEDHSTKNVLKNLLVLKNLGIDRFVWDTALLWVIAGVILVVVSFTNGAIPDPIRKHMGLVAVLHHRWKVRFWISSERMERTGQYWKTHHTIQGSNVEERCCLLYAESKKEKEHEAARPSVLNVDKSSCSSRSSFIQELLTYIGEMIYNRNPQVVVLTKRDLEILLLKELGDSFNSRVLDDIMSIVDNDKVSLNQSIVVSAYDSQWKLLLYSEERYHRENFITFSPQRNFTMTHQDDATFCLAFTLY